VSDRRNRAATPLFTTAAANAQFTACQNADFSFELTPVRPCSSASSPILLELSDTILDNNRYRSRLITCDVALVPFLLMTTLMRKVGRAVGSTAASSLVYSTYDTIRYDTRCYFNVRSKADISQLNLPHGTDN